MLFLQESEQVARWGRPLGQDPAAADPSGVRRQHRRRAHQRRHRSAASPPRSRSCVPLLDPDARRAPARRRAGAAGGGDDITIEQPDRPTCAATSTAARTSRCSGSPPTTPTRRTCGSRCSTGSTTTSGAPATATCRPNNLRRRPDAGAWSGSRRRCPAPSTTTRSRRCPASTRRGCRPRPRSAGSSPTATGATTRPPWTSSPATSGLTTAGLHYSMIGGRARSRRRPTWRRSPSSVRAGQPPLHRAARPASPPIVRTLANEVTRDAPSRYEKAVALQNWFRDDGGFTYSLTTRTPATAPTTWCRS